MNLRILQIILAFALTSANATEGLAKAAALELTGEGRALQPIVISPTASESTKAVAGELSAYLNRISGAHFTVETGDGTHGIVVGTIKEFPNPALADALEIHDSYNGREAFQIHTEADRLLLLGATDLGVSHAVFRLLERLGCRWFFPTVEWEVVPAKRNISVALNITEKPKILARRIWYGYGSFADGGHPRGGSTLKDYDAWARHNLMASSFRVYTGHAWQALIAANKAAFAEHPEYLALVKGTRGGEQLCVSNPEVRRLAIEWALDFLQKNPDREMVSMECSDGAGQCECAECAKLGSVSDRVFGLANDVAKEVARKFPGKLVGCLAYNQHSEPPSFELEPNVYVQLTAGFILGRYTHDELLELWPKKCKNLGFYEYFSVWLWDFDKLPGGNGANLTRTKTMIDRYVRAEATSFDAESGNNWGLYGRGYYIANKLLWNPEADTQALLGDFYEKAFGPGAPAMRRYYEHVAPEADPLLSRGFMGEALRDVQEAALLSKGRPDVQARLDQLKHYWRYVHLRWLLDHEKDKARQKELSIAALTLVYRTRYEYMNHWAAMRSSWASRLAKDFNEPSWIFNDKSLKPWMVETPVTKAETDQWFDEGLDYFRPTPVTEMHFSADLVPVSFAANKPVVSLQTFQRPAQYALNSRSGEALEIEITTGVIAWYRDRAEAQWRLRDTAGNLIAEGRLPQDGDAHSLTIAVPKSGTYFFDFNDAAAGWRIKGAPDRSISLLNQRGKKLLPLGQLQEMFFYVPKGTRVLQYFWSGAEHKVMDAGKHVVADITTDDEVVSIPVPEGKDGEVWSLSPRGQSQLWFFNAPNSIAASPNALLLPKELVSADEIAQPR